jgi:membrane protein
MKGVTVGIEAVIFDADGTLIDSNLLHVLAWQRAFRRLGREVEANAIVGLIGMGGDQLAPRILGNADEAEAERARAFYAEEYSTKGLVEHVEPFPGAAELIRAVRDRGLRTALASSGEQQDVERYLDLLGGRGAFDELVTSADVEATKPAPDAFALALDRLGNPDHAIVVGDTAYDIQAAAKIGLPCVVVRSGGIEPGVLEEEGAAAVYDGAADLLAHLDEALAR